MKYKRPTKAVIPAAGFGTRFLPQTKAMPKEMLPLIDKPIIQYLVEDLVEAGIKDIIIVTGYTKRGIEDHFDVPNRDLVSNLMSDGEKKKHLLAELEAIGNLANFCYVRQKGVQGNARPVLNVRHLIGDEPFIYAYPDDVIVSKPNRFIRMMDLFEELQATMLLCLEAGKPDDYVRYGFIGGEEIGDNLVKMNTIIEKPGDKKSSPSDMYSVGGYLLTPDIFKYLEKAETASPDMKEFFIQPVMLAMMEDNKPFYGFKIDGAQYCDTGAKLDYLKTVVQFALMREDIGDSFREYLRTLVL